VMTDPDSERSIGRGMVPFTRGELTMRSLVVMISRKNPDLVHVPQRQVPRWRRPSPSLEAPTYLPAISCLLPFRCYDLTLLAACFEAGFFLAGPEKRKSVQGQLQLG
jgi:hypothetical protein